MKLAVFKNPRRKRGFFILSVILLISTFARAADLEVVTDKKEIAELRALVSSASIHIPYLNNQKVQLTYGRADAFDPEDKTIPVSASLIEPTIYFRHNEALYSLALFQMQYGGNGRFQILKQIRLSPKPVREVQSSLTLADRQPVIDLKIEGTEVIVRQMVHKKEEAMCCPTGEKRFTLKLNMSQAKD